MPFEQNLYPLKFTPILKQLIWGGDNLHTKLGKKAMKHCGESWELSGVEDNISVVTNGFLKDNDLQELIEVYMGDLVGDKIYEQFGLEFPILIKFIDAQDNLSIQVHPDDKLAVARQHLNGKTEMWYILEAEPDSELIIGFNQQVDRDQYLKAVHDGKLKDILHSEPVTRGDVFFIPAGRIHAIGKKILLAEIQQTSDISYRIYDWDRVDDHGKPRQLHTDLALDAIDFSVQKQYKTSYPKQQGTTQLVTCPYFTTNMVKISQSVEKDFHFLDSFVIYMCLEGTCNIEYPQGNEVINKGDTVLIPAIMKNFWLKTSGPVELLEVYIE